MATIGDLGKKAKAKYPGSYDDLSDEQLGSMVQKKYPGSYDDFTPESPMRGSFTAQTPFDALKSARPSTAVAGAPWNQPLRVAPKPPPVPGAPGGVAPGPPQPPLPRALMQPEDQEDYDTAHPTPGMTASQRAVSNNPWSQSVGQPLGAGVARLADPARAALQDAGNPEGGPPDSARRQLHLTPALRKQAVSGGNELFSGAMEAALPLMGEGIGIAPARTLLTVGGSMATQRAAERSANAMGIAPEYSTAIGNVVGGVTGGLLHGGFTENARGPRVGDVRGRSLIDPWSTEYLRNPEPPPAQVPGGPMRPPFGKDSGSSFPSGPAPGPGPVQAPLGQRPVTAGGPPLRAPLVPPPDSGVRTGPAVRPPIAGQAGQGPPRVQVAGLFDLRDQIARENAGAPYGQLAPADRADVDRMALEAQRQQKADGAPPPADIPEQAAPPEQPPLGPPGLRPAMWPPPVNLQAPPEFRGMSDQALSEVAQTEGQGPKRDAAAQEMERRGMPGPPPVQTAEPPAPRPGPGPPVPPKSAAESGHVFQEQMFPEQAERTARLKADQDQRLEETQTPSKFDDAAAAARQRLRDKGIYSGRASANEFLDPETMRDMVITIAHSLKEGFVTAQDMIAQFGEHVRPHINELMRQAREYNASPSEEGGVEPSKAVDTPSIRPQVIRPAEQIDKEIQNIRPLPGETAAQMMERGNGLIHEYSESLTADRRLKTADISRRLAASSERLVTAKREFYDGLVNTYQKFSDNLTEMQRRSEEHFAASRARFREEIGLPPLEEDAQAAAPKPPAAAPPPEVAGEPPQADESAIPPQEEGVPTPPAEKKLGGKALDFLRDESGTSRLPTRQELGDKWNTSQRNFREEVTDRYAATSDLVKRSKGQLPDNENPHIAARNFAGAGGRALKLIQYDLQPIYRDARKDGLYEAMGQYALYERYEELADRGIDRFPNGQTIHQIQTDKRALENTLGPQKLAKVQGYVQKLQKYSNDLLAMARDGGLISSEQHDAIRLKNQKYIPLQRLAYLADQIESGKGDASSFSVRSQDLIHTIQGSELEIVNPLDAIVKNTYRTIQAIERNKVAQRTGDLAQRPEYKGVVSELKPGESVKPGMDTISAMRDGKRADYTVPKDVGAALKNLNSKQVDLVTKAASKAGAALRSGATSLNIGFLASNIVRDYQTATAVSRVGFTPATWLSGLWEAAKMKGGFGDQTIIKQYLDSGGSMSGYFSSFKDLPGSADALSRHPLIAEAKSAGAKAAAGAAVGAYAGGLPGAGVGAAAGLVLHTVHHLGELTELTPRLGVFKRSLSQGLSLEESGFNSRNSTVDFSKSGNTARLVNLWVPFLTARLGGNINLFQALRPSQVKARNVFGANLGPRQVATWNALKLGTMVGIPVVATYLFNHRNEEVAKVWDSLSQYEKRANFIPIFGGAQDEEGYYTQAFKIPKGDVKAFANPLESMMDYLGENHPDQLVQLAKAFGFDYHPGGASNSKGPGQLAVEFTSDVSPVDFEQGGKVDLAQAGASVVPPTAKGLAEGYSNKNWYTGRQLVPDYFHGTEEGKAHPEEQYTDRTSKLGVKIGKALGVSPMKVDNFAATQFGGLGRQVMSMSGSQKKEDGLGTAATGIERRYLGARGNQDEKARQNLAEIEAGYADTGMERARTAEGLADKFDAMKPEERGTFIQKMIDSGQMDEGLADALVKSIEGRQMGLTPMERALKSRPLQVRAQYIADEIMKAKPEDREKIIDRYSEKKILTEKVAELMGDIMQTQPAGPPPVRVR